MKTIILTVFFTLAVVVLSAAVVTKININQIVGGGTGTFYLTSTNGTVAWGMLPTAPNVPNTSNNETPGGTVNGTNQSFTLAHADALTASSNSLLLFRNGVLQQGGGNDYTLSGASITFTAGSTPQTGDILLASYQY